MIYSDPQIKGIIRCGGVIAYPTEAVWGLGCCYTNQQAVKKILDLKDRSVEKGLVLVAGDIRQIYFLLDKLAYRDKVRFMRSTGRFQTWLIPDVCNLIPGWIKGSHSSVAIRISLHPQVQKLCTDAQTLLVSTSANPAGCLPAYTKWQTFQYFGHKIDSYIDGPTMGYPAASPIKHLINGETVRS